MSDQLTIAQAVIARMVPHREQFETGPFYGWRVSTTAFALFMGGVLAVHIALACGLISLFGFTGFAQANDVGDIKAIQAQMQRQMVAGNNDVMAIVVGGQIFDLANRRCSAIKARNMDAVNSYSQELQSKLDLYIRVSGRSYPLQACP